MRLVAVEGNGIDTPARSQTGLGHSKRIANQMQALLAVLSSRLRKPGKRQLGKSEIIEKIRLRLPQAGGLSCIYSMYLLSYCVCLQKKIEEGWSLGRVLLK